MLTYKTLQCCKDAKVVWFDDFSDKFLKGYKNWACPRLTCNYLRCAPTPYRLRRPQSALLSSHRTYRLRAIPSAATGFTHSTRDSSPSSGANVQHSLHGLCSLHIGCSFVSSLIPKPRLMQFQSLPVRDSFA